MWVYLSVYCTQIVQQVKRTVENLLRMSHVMYFFFLRTVNGTLSIWDARSVQTESNSSKLTENAIIVFKLRNGLCEQYLKKIFKGSN